MSLTILDVTDALSGNILIVASYATCWKSMQYKPISGTYTIYKDGEIIARTNDMENAVTTYNTTEI